MSDDKKTIRIPQAPESEAAVLGSIIIDPQTCMKKIAHLLTYKDFYFETNRYIYRAMEYLFENQKDIDVVTICDVLTSKGYLDAVGGPGTITMLASDVATPAHVVTHAKIVADRATLRNTITAAQDIIKMTQGEEDLDVLLQKAEDRLKGVTKSSARREDRLTTVDMEQWRQIARDTTPDEGHIRGLSSGYKGLDDMLEGIEPGEMIILTGHTKHGKSRLATNIAVNVARTGKTVLFINTEMTKLQMGRRLNQILGDEVVPGRFIANDRAGLESRDVIRLMEKAKEQGCDFVIVDHLHFFSRSVDNQTNELSKITKEFKDAAVQFDLPLLMLCHVGQEKTSMVPTLKSLKGSSSIAQDADVVITVWVDDRTNGDSSFTDVVRLAHRSASKSIKRIRLYNDGMRLVEDQSQVSEAEREKLAQQVSFDQRRLGEKEDDNFDLEGFDEKDLSILPDFTPSGSVGQSV